MSGILKKLGTTKQWVHVIEGLFTVSNCRNILTCYYIFFPKSSYISMHIVWIELLYLFLLILNESVDCNIEYGLSAKSLDRLANLTIKKRLQI